MSDIRESSTLAEKTSNTLLTINFALGVVLWFGLCSDYSWDNLWMNIIFAPLVGLIGLVSFFRNRNAISPRQKTARLFFCLPSLIGGIPALLFIVLAIIPPFLFPALFWLEEKNGAILIQESESPNGLKTAEVYYLPIGGYTRNGGRIEVHLKDSRMPLVKRDIFYLRKTQTNEKPQEYLSWISVNEIYIPETNETIKINSINWKLPFPMTLPAASHR